MTSTRIHAPVAGIRLGAVPVFPQHDPRQGTYPG
jgi:hypothetical protein